MFIGSLGFTGFRVYRGTLPQESESTEDAQRPQALQDVLGLQPTQASWLLRGKEGRLGAVRALGF